MESTYRSAMNSLIGFAPDSICFKDLKGKHSIVNESKASNYGVTPAEMIGKTDFDFLPKEEAESSLKDDLEVIRTGNAVIDKVEKITRPTGEVYVSVSKFPWKNDKGKIIGVIVISRDVTERENLKSHILDMLSIASHDFRSPLNTIAATLKLLIRGRFGDLNESVRNSLEGVFARIDDLSKKLERYLEKSSILNAGIPNKTIFDLREDVIDPIIFSLENDIEKEDIQIDNAFGGVPIGKIQICADKKWLEIIYQNLLSNAIIFAGKEKNNNPKRIIAFGFENVLIDGKPFYKLNVYNNGPPIKDDEKDKIFLRFESSEGSSGMGLAIIRDLVRKHGGDLWCEDALDGHPTFIFTIPQ